MTDKTKIKLCVEFEYEVTGWDPNLETHGKKFIVTGKIPVEPHINMQVWPPKIVWQHTYSAHSWEDIVKLIHDMALLRVEKPHKLCTELLEAMECESAEDNT